MRTLPNELWTSILHIMVDDAEEGLIGEEFEAAIRDFSQLPAIYARLALVSKLFNSIAGPLRDSILYIDDHGRGTRAIEHFRVGQQAAPRGDLFKVRYAIFLAEVDDNLMFTLDAAFVNARVILSHSYFGPYEPQPNCRILWTYRVPLRFVAENLPKLKSLAVREGSAAQLSDDDSEQLSLVQLQIYSWNAAIAQLLGRCSRLQELVLADILSENEAEILRVLPQQLRKLDIGAWSAGDCQYDFSRLPPRLEHLTIELGGHACAVADRECQLCVELGLITAQLAKHDPIRLPRLRRLTLELDMRDEDACPDRGQAMQDDLAQACKARDVVEDIRNWTGKYINNRFGCLVSFDPSRIGESHRKQRQLLYDVLEARSYAELFQKEIAELKRRNEELEQRNAELEARLVGTV